MSASKVNPRRVMTWLFVGTLLVLCGVLGALQYRWIGEVSVAERDRLRKTLQSSLDRVSAEFNGEIVAACTAILPNLSGASMAEVEREIPPRYEQWRSTSRNAGLFRRIALAVPQNGGLALRGLDMTSGDWNSAKWPPEWKSFQTRMEGRLGMQEGRPTGDPGLDDAMSFELPVIANWMPPGPFGRREAGWVIFQLNADGVRENVLPELLQRHLGTGGSQEYQIEVVTHTTPPSTIYQSNVQGGEIEKSADASASLFELRFDQFFRAGPGGGMGRRGAGADRGPGPGFGRWQMYARHRKGSLEAVVESIRLRNLMVTAGVLLLMLASVAALVLFTRRAQKLAHLQMDFVAGVSHELRTPLTVIHTAAYNLRGKTAQNPAQVERYGTLIQQESGRLKELVEQVLRFASASAGRVIQDKEPVAVESVIGQALEGAGVPAGCELEAKIDPDLPVILADAMALKQALLNLLGNAVKYGADGKWIGVRAARKDGMVEIHVQDRGPGIPHDEQKHVFDAFFRGKRALQDQVHGTGLGLNLVKRIVEAHGGTIEVRSDAGKGTDFAIRLPVAPAEYQNGVANTSHRG